MQVKFFDPGLSYSKIKPEIDSEIQRVLSAGDLILRSDIEKFEENLADFVGTKYAVAVSSGTDALYLALKALNLEEKKVAVPSYTFKATAGAVVNSGAFPVVYDMDGTFVGSMPDAYIPVHIAGELFPANYGNIPMSDAEYLKKVYGLHHFLSLGIPIIEDACQALGAIKNPTTNVQCWSFYPAKILGAYGDAGAITTNDSYIAEYAREARNHFKNDNRDFGGNYRMDNLQAAILNVKFKYLPQYLERRKSIAEMYLEKLKNISIELPVNTTGRVWQDFIIRTKKRDELFSFLREEGIETLKNEYPWSSEYPKFPLAAKYEAETLRLPCNPDLTDEQIEYVIEKIKLFYGGK